MKYKTAKMETAGFSQKQTNKKLIIENVNFLSVAFRENGESILL